MRAFITLRRPWIAIVESPPADVLWPRKPCQLRLRLNVAIRALECALAFRPAGKREPRNSYLSQPAPPRCHVAVRGDDLPFVLPAVPGAADHRQADPAVVRRLGRGLDDVPGVLPERAARGLRVCGLDHAPGAAPPGDAARGAPRGVAPLPADPRLGRLEAAGDEEPILRILLLLGATIGLPYLLLSKVGRAHV